MKVVSDSINRYDTIIPTKPKAMMEKLNASLAIDVKELCYYQEKKSIAYMKGLIDLDLANYLYEKLNDWANTTLAERVTLTQVFVRIARGF